MNKKFATIFAICTLGLITACGSKDKGKKDIDISDFKSYDNSGYSISLPTDWGKTDNKNADIAFLYKSSDNDFFTENITVIIQDLDTYDYTLDTYKELSVSQYEELGYEIDECKKVTLDENECYSITSHSENDGKNIYCKQIFTLLNKKAYLFTFAAEEKDFKTLSDEIDAIFDTIKFNVSTEENTTSENITPPAEPGISDEIDTSGEGTSDGDTPPEEDSSATDSSVE